MDNAMTIAKPHATHVETPPETTWTPVICLLDGTTLRLPGGLSHGDAMDTAGLAADELPNVDYVGAVREGVSRG